MLRPLSKTLDALSFALKALSKTARNPSSKPSTLSILLRPLSSELSGLSPELNVLSSPASGSGSLALGLLLQHKGLVPQGAAMAITQPSGEALTVQFFDASHGVAGNAAGAGGACCHAYVAGSVQLVAEGTAYCT